MSRREIIVNTLLGAGLLLSFLLCVSLCFAVAMLAFNAMSSAWKHFFPALTLPDNVTILAFIALGSLATGIKSEQPTDWRGTFLTIATAAGILSLWLAPSQPLVGQQGPDSFSWTMLLIFGIMPRTYRLTRFEFILGNAAVAANIVAGSGMLGFDHLSRIVLVGAQLSAFLLMALDLRKNRNSQSSETRAAFSPVGA